MASKILLFYNFDYIVMLFEMLLILILTLRCQNPNVLYLWLFVNRTITINWQKSVENIVR